MNMNAENVKDGPGPGLGREAHAEEDAIDPGVRLVPAVALEALADGVVLREERLDPHERDHKVAVVLSKVGFSDPSVTADTLSGGWRTRLAIARALAADPDVVLLDEPTNHLDLESRLWLESLLINEAEAFVVVSHDRYFLQNVGRRMFDIDRVYAEGLIAVDGSYADLLEKRDEILSNQASYEEALRM